MKEKSSTDLHLVRNQFEAWRAGRTKRQRIPETLWAAAVSLLDRYPFGQVCRELRIGPKQLRKHRLVNGQKPQQRKRSKQTFLELPPHALSTPQLSAHSLASDPPHLLSDGACRVVLERVDGSRLSFTLPVDWSRIEALCADFLRAV